MSTLMEHVRSTVLRDDASTDGQLLQRFIERRDEAAFAALVRRHGTMVWSVCCRLLPAPDAEDAFQTTFLVLVRKAVSIMPREKVANWLYGVAHQAALHARRTAARRRAREKQVKLPEPAVTDADPWSDLQLVLDQALSRLPDAHREVIVLSDLEGKTRREVARQLGVPEGTVASRLARARAELAKRLTQRGVTLAGGALAVMLAQQVSANMPASVIDRTIHAAWLFAAGQAVSETVAGLTDGVMKAMLSAKLKSVVAIVLLGLFAAGGAWLTSRTAAGQDAAQHAADNSVAAGTPKLEPAGTNQEPITAWGKEVGGLQAGLGYRPRESRVYRPGEAVKLVVRVRNVGKEEVRFQYLRHFFIENPPTVVDDTGKPVALIDGTAKGIYKPLDVVLAPGMQIALYELNLTVGAKNIDPRKASTLFGEGNFQLQYKRVLGDSKLSSVSIQCDPKFRKLETGTLDLVVSRWIRRWASEKEEAITAWGKQVGGLQAGLGLRHDEHQIYRHGDLVTLIIRVRNVTKKTVKFSYLQPFIEHSLTVTNGDGTPVPQPRVLPDIGEYLPGELELAPGQEIDVHEVRRQLRPAREGGVDKLHNALYAIGKIGIEYDQVLGLPERGVPGWKLDPVLAKLATGKLKLEVMEELHDTGAPKAATRAYTTEELIRAVSSLMPNENVAVQFKVRLVQPSAQIRKGPEHDADWVVGHGRDDLALHPQGRLDHTRDQFAVLLTAKAMQQLTRLGIKDVGKHLQGRSIRVTGPITSFLPITDEPICGRQFEIVVTDLSQLEVVGP
jgi:RNA polymerase sigma factor (sigma-70 family)